MQEGSLGWQLSGVLTSGHGNYTHTRSTRHANWIIYTCAVSQGSCCFSAQKSADVPGTCGVCECDEGLTIMTYEHLSIPTTVVTILKNI